VKVTLIFVTTLDGKVTKWGDPHVFRWSSKEDQSYFKKTWNDAKCIIMGSGTFKFDPVKPSPERLLTIMTHSPEYYEKYHVPGQLEFTSESPANICARLAGEGHEEVLLVGGAHLATSFLNENLVDEVWLTLEPRIFGSGGNFVLNSKLDLHLQLISSEKVNEQGTLILKYHIKTND
jgi:dihydrofolate reductase